MQRVYEVTVDSGAPRLEFVDPGMAARYAAFDGRPMLEAWPGAPEVRCARPSADPFVFYQLAPGALVVDAQALMRCEHFYWVTLDGCEPLELRMAGRSFEIIHVTASLPPDGRAPCKVDRYYSALFRIDGRSPVSVFCASGVAGVEMNEFKPVYDRYGFSGLEFNEIWKNQP